MLFPNIRRLIAWIDSFGDCFNPITVRELRRLSCRYLLEGGALLLLAILVVGLLVALSVLYDLGDIRAVLEIPDGSRNEMVWFVAVLPLGVAVYAMIISSVLPMTGLAKTQFEDELLGLVPLTPKQHVHGYLAASCLFSGVCISLFFPFVAAVNLVGRAPLWPLAALVGLYLAGQAFSVFTLSLSVRLKSRWENILVVGCVYVLMFLMGAPWFGIAVLLEEVFKKPMPSPQSGFAVFLLWVFLPAVVGVLAYVGYRLSIYHFERQNKPYWRAALLNTGIYTLTSVAFASVFLVLCFVFL